MERLDIMVSSSSLDLPDHRHQVIEAILRMGHFPLAMEHSTARSDGDVIKFSLEMVDQADVYVGVFAERYGYRPLDSERNPSGLSITELEFRRALETKKPILAFISHAEHKFEISQIDLETDSRDKLTKLKNEILLGNLCAFFRSEADLRGLTIQALSQLQVSKSDADEPTLTDKVGLPAAPALYAVPQYKLTNQFVGRSSELDVLDSWAKSSGAIMVVESIGGLGKSALAWEWMIARAEKAIPQLAGRVWWSFYERGTSMVEFVRHTLAYITSKNPESLTKDSSPYHRTQQLLAELSRRPYLLVLDGFERVLAAYHRLEKTPSDDKEIDFALLRDCVNPADGELVTQLLDCMPSRILITTRLMPSSLQDRASRRPIEGVAVHRLEGLSEPDALKLMRQAGVKGDQAAMLDFANQFDRHSLVLRIVCGLVADYRKKPYDFDSWRADPFYGGSLQLSEVGLNHRNSHILHFALRGLDATTHKLLSRIAIFSESASYDTLAILNPFLPMELEGIPTQASQYRDAARAFDAALTELEARGLLQWDRDENRYEMHPIVRACAADRLEPHERNETFDKLRNHFSSLPPDNFATATELAHVNHSLEIYRCLVGAGRLREAMRFYEKQLSDTLLFHIGAFSVIIDLHKLLFKENFGNVSALNPLSMPVHAVNELEIAYIRLRRTNEALDFNRKAMSLYLESGDWSNLARTLINLSISLRQSRRRAEADEALRLAHVLADAIEDVETTTRSILELSIVALEQGRFADADLLISEFESRQEPSMALYRTGDAEYWTCRGSYFQNSLYEGKWQTGYALNFYTRNINMQCLFLSLRAEWDLTEFRPSRALEAIDLALRIANKIGARYPEFHDLRAWALACLNRRIAAEFELSSGEHGLFAAEAYMVLGETDRAQSCALNAYREAWGEGPPYVHWYFLERSRTLLHRLGASEPQILPFDPAKFSPIPFEAEIRATIKKLEAKKGKQ